MHEKMTCSAAATLLRELLFWMQLAGENAFKIKAWEKAVAILEEETQSLSEFVAQIQVTSRQGIGSSIEATLVELVQVGTLQTLEDYRKQFPAGLLELRFLSGLGAKKITFLHQEGISSLEQLDEAIQSGRLVQLKGFGKASVDKLAAVVALAKASRGKIHLDKALQLTQQVKEFLLQQDPRACVETLGEVRQGSEVVSSIDIAVVSTVDFGERQQDLLQNSKGECQLKIERVSAADLGACLLKNTGSSAFLSQLKNHAEQKNVCWEKLLASAKTEAQLFAELGLEYIEPVLREGFDEIELAAQNKLPKLVEYSQLKGTFHNHTTASDGKHSLAEMAAAAQAMGLEYFGVADHSVSAFQANGLSIKRLQAQIAEIAQLNQHFAETGVRMRVFAGSEVEIRKDGSLDYPDEILAQLDYVVAALHTPLGLSQVAQTKRMIAAIEHPLVTMVAHPSSRLLLRRPAIDLDLVAVAKAAAATNTVVEINSNPWRLDLDWRIWRTLKANAPLCSVNPDAHACAHLDYLKLGVQMARKSALTKQQILNTKSTSEVESWLKLAKDKRINTEANFLDS